MEKVTLTQPATIAGETFQAGREIIISEKNLEKAYGEHQRNKVRAKIREEVADEMSILGTVSDATSLLLLSFSKLLLTIAEAQSLEELRQNVMNLEAHAFCQSFLEGIDKGEILLSSQTKGMDVVYKEITDRLTKTAKIFV